MEKYLHGENGITFSLFSEINSTSDLNKILKTVRWLKNKPQICKNEFQIHLFPSFGKAIGLGEPDFLILSKSILIFGEIETDSVIKLSSHFFRQIARFIKLGKFFQKTKRRIIRGKPIGIDESRFKGQFRTRKLFKGIASLENKNNIFFIVITNDRPQIKNGSKERKTQEILRDQIQSKGIQEEFLLKNLGWIGLPSVKRLDFLKKTKEIINFNLKK